MIDRRRLRGELAATAQRLASPFRRRFPLDAWRRVHARLRRHFPEQFTDADPFTVRWIDPDRITETVIETSPKYPQWGRVIGGAWDRETTPFEQQAVPQAIVERFEEGREWQETMLYDAFVTQLARFGNAWGYTTLDGFESRCQEIERLYRTIEREGYRSQRALRNDGVNATPVLDEINVDIGRDGRLLWRAYGQHRLAIAKCLDIDSVPVFFHRRHREWQATRTAVQRADSEYTADSHPDLWDC